MSGYRIAVLVPSRGRPHNIERLYSAIQDTAANPDQVFLAVRVDEDDPELTGYRKLSEDMIGAGGFGWDWGPRTRLAASWNEMARVLTSPGWPDDGQPFTHLALWGDDVLPETRGWDQRFVQRLAADGPGFVYGPDGIWDHTYDSTIRGQLVLPTACVMSVEIYRALGYVAPAPLVHLCIDVAWRDLGLATDSLFYERDVMIRHLHRLTGAPDDATYQEANDNPEQYRNDMSGIDVWKSTGDFQRAVNAIHAVRERWMATQVGGGV